MEIAGNSKYGKLPTTVVMAQVMALPWQGEHSRLEHFHPCSEQLQFWWGSALLATWLRLD